jgi:hypothetical protein
MSPVTRATGQPANAEQLLVGRTSTVTASPRAASARTRVLPKKPLAPVTSTFIISAAVVKGKSKTSAAPQAAPSAAEFFHHQSNILTAKSQ